MVIVSLLVHLCAMEKLEKRVRKSIAPGGKPQLEQLKGYKIIHKKSSRVFDELVVYTASLFNTQIAIINFVDQHNLWQKKGQHLNQVMQVYTETNVCSLAVANETSRNFQASSLEPAHLTNPMIMAESGMAFYAAVPITTAEGVQVGTVCIVDKSRREFLAQDKEKLEWVAGMVQKEMEKKTSQNLYV